MTTRQMTQYRSVWMGIAILWVMYFHGGFPALGGVMTSIKNAGYGAVDIFMFAAGLGCYYSYGKSEDSLIFLKRRIRRVLPIYWLFLIPWFYFMYKMNFLSTSMVVGNLLFVQYFTGKGWEFNWYVAAMWFTYLLTPFFYDIVNGIKSHLKALGIVVIMILMTYPFWDVNMYIIFVTRLPLFFMGMYLASLGEREIKKWHGALLISSFVAGCCLLSYVYRFHEPVLWSRGWHWYPFILIVPGLCFLISLVCFYLDKLMVGRFVVKAFSFVGGYTFELYLMHMLLFKIFGLYGESGELVLTNTVWLMILGAVFVASAVLAVASRLLVMGYDKISMLLNYWL